MFVLGRQINLSQVEREMQNQKRNIERLEEDLMHEKELGKTLQENHVALAQQMKQLNQLCSENRVFDVSKALTISMTMQRAFQAEKETVRNILQAMGKNISVDFTKLSDNLNTSVQDEKETVRHMLQTREKGLNDNLTTLSNYLNTSLVTFNNEIRTLRGNHDRQIERLNKELTTMKTATENKFSENAISIETKLEGVAKNVEGLKGDIHGIKTKLQTNARVVDQLKSTVGRHEMKLSKYI